MLIVNCHNVVTGDLDTFDRLSAPRIDMNNFISAIDWLSCRYEFISFDEMFSLIHQKAHKPEAVTLTFDDGYQGILKHAFPILKARGIVASVMVVTQVLESPKSLFHFEELEMAFRLSKVTELILPGCGVVRIRTIEDRVACLKKIKQKLKLQPEAMRAVNHEQLLRLLEVTREQVQEEAEKYIVFNKLTGENLKNLAENGWTIGSHTRTHRTLGFLNDRDAKSEIGGALDDVRSYFGVSQVPFAYPYGGREHVGERIRSMVSKSGYSCALGTKYDTIGFDPDLFFLNRLDITACQSFMNCNPKP